MSIALSEGANCKPLHVFVLSGIQALLTIGLVFKCVELCLLVLYLILFGTTMIHVWFLPVAEWMLFGRRWGVFGDPTGSYH